jgi:Holliday junction resolvase-like predicted endonuclease
MKVDEKQVKALVKVHLKEAPSIREQAEKAAVTNHASYETVSDVLLTVKERMKQISEEKEKVLGLVKQIIAAVNGWFKQAEEDYGETELILKRKLGEYIVACEKKRLDTMRKAVRLAKVDKAKSRDLVAKADTLSAPKVAGISYKARIDWEVVDESKIPEEYFMRVLDNDKLDQALANGVEIEGVVLTSEVSISATPSRRAKGE